jgi:hypothetical protein
MGAAQICLRDHRVECRAARVILPGESARFGGATSFRASIIPCKWAAAFSMSYCLYWPSRLSAVSTPQPRRNSFSSCADGWCLLQAFRPPNTNFPSTMSSLAWSNAFRLSVTAIAALLLSAALRLSPGTIANRHTLDVDRHQLFGSPISNNRLSRAALAFIQSTRNRIASANPFEKEFDDCECDTRDIIAQP